ncbi:predicted protein [Phaeodactylum tricornutum CCAP 1055/1]|jgi:hypothetical protein|uniref:Uncharacterized protein n=1 Tax=Phaeodactylum tricornutum (strain CCAP 1055/1) TaxID=556484 RepID=B7FQX8_PHATC|nr:predicted protein [Phaeodactylum tricornutum CCAP 1055/1]XP_002177485.1 predicted protein [Phaeodactylum tricornutum CCAP 1055/1]EEC51946.1 predicted protein [Phaeodactylum tricornutum CCAP 1055/1]EEC51948.1 predicted protein [Phaeodactylum tricornutum CCAP 1055/1]|eukprot:XP_002177483.1 predicted protein [Phaeodactylum tricornutum CCAP 1055/1]
MSHAEHGEVCDDSPLLELNPVEFAPFKNVNEFLIGFCRPRQSLSSVPDGNTQILVDDSASQSSSYKISPSSRGLEAVINVHPYTNLKRALHYGFCDPTELVGDERKSATNRSINSGVTTQTIDSGDISSITAVPDEQEDDEDEQSGIIFTHPGTGRAIRVYKALEVFVLTIAVLIFAFRTLRKLNVPIGFELKTRIDEDEPSFYFSFS